MHAAGIFPSAPRLMSDPLFALAAAYRAVFTIAGGYVTAHLAPDRPMRHAWILAGIGLVAGLAGVVAYYAIGGAELGPAWYAISIPVEAIPCGGWHDISPSKRQRSSFACSQSGANVTWQLVEDGRGRRDLPQGGGPAAAASKA